MKKNYNLITAALLLCLSANNLFSQLTAFAPKAFVPVLDKKKEIKKSPYTFGMGTELYASGNAHGAFYSFRLNVSKNKSIFSIGPCLQKRSSQINGIKIGYSYLLSGGHERYDEHERALLDDSKEDFLQLRLFAYVQYLHNAALSYAASRVETITNRESTTNFNEVKLSTIEGAVCAELDFNFERLRIRTYMGGTVFYHTTYIQGMYRERISPALTFGTGIIIPHF